MTHSRRSLLAKNQGIEMIRRRRFSLLVCVVVFHSSAATYAADDVADLSNADRFAFEILDPSMEFVWRDHRIRQKLLARLGIPDEMELRTVSERTADFFWAREEWNYVGGPKLVLYSNDNEWIESISIPVNSQIILPFNLYVGAPRKNFVEKLKLDKAKDRRVPRVTYQSDLRTTFGPVSIAVTIEFDENDNSTQITWQASE